MSWSQSLHSGPEWDVSPYYGMHPSTRPEEQRCSNRFSWLLTLYGWDLKFGAYRLHRDPWFAVFLFLFYVYASSGLGLARIRTQWERIRVVARPSRSGCVLLAQLRSQWSSIIIIIIIHNRQSIRGTTWHFPGTGCICTTASLAGTVRGLDCVDSRGNVTAGGRGLASVCVCQCSPKFSLEFGNGATVLVGVSRPVVSASWMVLRTALGPIRLRWVSLVG